MWNYFFRVCMLNRTSVYLRLFDYVSDQLCISFFILARHCTIFAAYFRA